jgi:hypothetical protein
VSCARATTSSGGAAGGRPRSGQPPTETQTARGKPRAVVSLRLSSARPS